MLYIIKFVNMHSPELLLLLLFTSSYLLFTIHYLLHITVINNMCDIYYIILSAYYLKISIFFRIIYIY